MLKVLGTLAGVVAGLYTLLVLTLALFQRAMIYHPGRERVEPSDIGLDRVVPVPVRSGDGWIITSWYAPPNDPRAPTIVFFQGNGGGPQDRLRKAKAFIEAGYGLYMVGYRGYAGNPGKPTEAGLYTDARSAMAWLTTRGLPEARLVLYGESLGGALAVQMAVEHPDVAAVVLEAAFTTLTALAPPYLLPGLAPLLMSDRYDNIYKIGGVRAPLLIVHGDKDTLVPAAMGRALLAAADCIKEAAFIEHAGHNDVWDEGGENAALDFLQKRLRS
jgi:uncharacterized protein